MGDTVARLFFNFHLSLCWDYIQDTSRKCISALCDPNPTYAPTLPTRNTLRHAQGTAFTGQYSYISDDATDLGSSGFGLMFYQSRWYDPSLGRMAQADTIVPGGVQGLDRYAYVNNSPLNYVDPSGHKACWATKHYTCHMTPDEIKKYADADAENGTCFILCVVYEFSPDSAEKLIASLDTLLKFTGWMTNIQTLGEVFAVLAALGTKIDEYLKGVKLAPLVGLGELAEWAMAGIAGVLGVTIGEASLIVAAIAAAVFIQITIPTITTSIGIQEFRTALSDADADTLGVVIIDDFKFFHHDLIIKSTKGGGYTEVLTVPKVGPVTDFTNEILFMWNLFNPQ